MGENSPTNARKKLKVCGIRKNRALTFTLPKGEKKKRCLFPPPDAPKWQNILELKHHPKAYWYNWRTQVFGGTQPRGWTVFTDFCVLNAKKIASFYPPLPALPFDFLHPPPSWILLGSLLPPSLYASRKFSYSSVPKTLP